jgi:hypothetical protein
MALAFGATALNTVNTKIFTVTCLDSDGAANLAVAFDGAAGRPNAMAVAPTDIHLVRTIAPDTANSTFAVTASATTGITLRKLTGGGAGDAISLRITCRSIHSIDQ